MQQMILVRPMNHKKPMNLMIESIAVAYNKMRKYIGVRVCEAS
jgi:hypothetical protein